MTKTTLKALWVGGGGLIATWFAVAPTQHTPVAPETPTQPPVVDARAAEDDHLQSQTEQLKREAPSSFEPAARNPFRFGTLRPAPTTDSRDSGTVEAEQMLLPPPPPPTLTLSGIAEKRVDGGVRRMAVLSSDTKLYLAGEGDIVEGRYTVIAVDREAVLLRDVAGGELRLVLRP